MYIYVYTQIYDLYRRDMLITLDFNKFCQQTLYTDFFEYLRTSHSRDHSYQL